MLYIVITHGCRLGIVDIIECGKEGEKEGAKAHDDWVLNLYSAL